MNGHPAWPAAIALAVGLIVWGATAAVYRNEVLGLVIAMAYTVFFACILEGWNNEAPTDD